MIKLYLIKLEGLNPAYISIPNRELIKQHPLGIEIQFVHNKNGAAIFNSKEKAEYILDKFILNKASNSNIYTIEEIYIHERRLNVFNFVEI